MKFAKSILTGAGAVVLAGLILALLAPKAAHAIVATAVQVENTVASPVVSQSILPGAVFFATCISTTSDCELSPAIPAGYTFHATYFSAQDSYSSTAKVPDPLLVSYSSNSSNGNFVADYEIAAPVGPFTTASHPVDWYIDPGTTIRASTGENNGQLAAFGVTVSGYLTH